MRIIKNSKIIKYISDVVNRERINNMSNKCGGHKQNKPQYTLLFLLFFFIPIKAKYLAYVDAALLIWSFFTTDFSGKMAILVAFLNIAIFFGGDTFNKIRDKFRYRKVRKNFRIQMSSRDNDDE